MPTNQPDLHRRRTGRMRSAVWLSVLIAATLFLGFWFGRRDRLRWGTESRGDSPLPGVEEPLVTLLHYCESGRRAAEAVLDRLEQSGRLEASTLARVRRACVRVEAVFDQQGGAQRQVLASGVVVAGYFVLTAGHALEGISNPRWQVTDTAGRRYAADVVEWDYEAFETKNRDWALLKLRARERAERDLVSLQLGDAVVGGTILAWGYPDGIGIEPGGSVMWGGPNPRPLSPLVTIGTVAQASPLKITPTAGFIPIGGLSGGPVVDLEGRVCGIFVSVSRSIEGDTARHWYNATTVAEARARIPKANK